MDGLKDVATATAAAAIPIVGVGGRCERIFCSFIRCFLGSRDAPLAFRTSPHAEKNSACGSTMRVLREPKMIDI